MWLGRRADAVKVVRILTQPGSNAQGADIALIYFALGDKDRGFERLTKVFDERQAIVRYVKASPRYDSVRPDPRFQALVARLKIPD